MWFAKWFVWFTLVTSIYPIAISWPVSANDCKWHCHLIALHTWNRMLHTNLAISCYHIYHAGSQIPTEKTTWRGCYGWKIKHTSATNASKAIANHPKKIEHSSFNYPLRTQGAPRPQRSGPPFARATPGGCRAKLKSETMQLDLQCMR